MRACIAIAHIGTSFFSFLSLSLSLSLSFFFPFVLLITVRSLDGQRNKEKNKKKKKKINEGKRSVRQSVAVGAGKLSLDSLVSDRASNGLNRSVIRRELERNIRETGKGRGGGVYIRSCDGASGNQFGAWFLFREGWGGGEEW